MFVRTLQITATSDEVTFRLGGRRQAISRTSVNWPEDPCTVVFRRVAIQVSPRSMLTNGHVCQTWLFDIRRRFRRKCKAAPDGIENTSSAILLGFCDATRNNGPTFDFQPLGERILRGVQVTIDETNQPKRIFRFPWKISRRRNAVQN